ncbi:methyltransferase domain-containing protein [Streptomyces sp. SCA3-4]|uniref:methyltransferase domain-containing protein n=1 Tax=Streptomyces sichuanensis TaxID=2871810 RepID=UPI001CE2901B|nr:methyltransferase domain-containing protein [Streptomyces sichuanensis]MCA6092614.1 methyltransferase domain-containing protein [Streptomyces sichuanensis]
MPNVSRVLSYQHLLGDDFVPPTSPQVFFEPADTETGVWVAGDLLTPGGSVLDLGSGSGAAAAAMARAGAARVHGIDSGAQTVAWARKHYASASASRNGGGNRPGEGRVTVAQGDFARMTTEELLATAPVPLPRPLVVTSNPPYVPLTLRADAQRRSISGGDDGLKWAPAVIGHGRALRSDLGLTIGSYSTPRKAVQLLEAAGYRVHAVTLCPLPLGEFTLANMEQVLALEEAGEAVVWRAARGAPAYFIVGLACRWTGPGRTATGHERLSGDGLLGLLHLAARSRTSRLEALDGPRPDGWNGPLRVLDLPETTVRHHW